MKLKLQSYFFKTGAYILTIIFSIYIGWIILRPWLVERQINNLLAGEGVHQSLFLKPQNAYYSFLLGRYFQYNPLLRDFQKAKDSYIDAILMNPVRAEYWIDLATVEDVLGNSIYAIKAIKRAIKLKPTGLNVHWEVANFWLKKGEIKIALKSFKYIIKNFPKERKRVYPLIWLATNGDLKMIMQVAIPEKIETKVDYIWYLIGRGRKGEAKKVWRSLSGRNLQPSIRLRYIDHLISWGEIEDAKKEWTNLKGLDNSSMSLIWNGGFEEKVTLNKGFDWKIDKVKGSEINIDNEKVKDGRLSLKIDFNGEENVDFSHVYQTVPLESERSYILSASMMTDNITTTNGMKIEFFGIKGCKFYKTTEIVTGTTPWKELKIKVKTPKECTVGKVRMRREKSFKFNNLISGTAWIDEVRLEEVP